MVVQGHLGISVTRWKSEHPRIGVWTDVPDPFDMLDIWLHDLAVVDIARELC